MSKSASPEKKSVALIAGPTASGKSDLAVRLAIALEGRGRNAVVINADSAQVYADLAILSARPTTGEMAGIEHRLFGTWDGAHACSAVDWAEAAKSEIAEAHARDAIPILVGGTGLYIRTLLDGIAPIPEIDPEVRTAVRTMSVSEARTALEQEDSIRAAQLHASDAARIARALEVKRSTGRSMAYWQEQREGGIAHEVSLHPLVLLPDREWLYQRCDRRFSAMVEQGAIGEVEHLLARGLAPGLPVMRAIGVPEIGAMLRGEVSREQAIERSQQATRNYAKRQYTWFRRQPPADWKRHAQLNYDMSEEFETLFLSLGLT